MEKHINIGGKDYTLTANRDIIRTIASICPDFLKIGNSKKISDDDSVKYGVELLTNIDKIFFEMIKVANPKITKKESDEILEAFEAEYNGVLQALIDLAMSVFPKDDQTKKKIVW